MREGNKGIAVPVREGWNRVYRETQYMGFDRERSWRCEMGWILFLNEEEKPCAWPDESTMVEISKGGEVMLTCGKHTALPAESPQHTQDWQQVLYWVEGDLAGDDDDDVVVEPGYDE